MSDKKDKPNISFQQIVISNDNTIIALDHECQIWKNDNDVSYIKESDTLDWYKLYH